MGRSTHFAQWVRDTIQALAPRTPETSSSYTNATNGSFSRQYDASDEGDNSYFHRDVTYIRREVFQNECE